MNTPNAAKAVAILSDAGFIFVESTPAAGVSGVALDGHLYGVATLWEARVLADIHGNTLVAIAGASPDNEFAPVLRARWERHTVVASLHLTRICGGCSKPTPPPIAGGAPLPGETTETTDEAPPAKLESLGLAADLDLRIGDRVTLKAPAFALRPAPEGKGLASRVLEGEITALTRKGLEFKGHASVRDCEWCHRCGRAIQHPASLRVGYGPICSDKLGIDWSVDGLDEAAITALKERIVRETYLTGLWLPRTDTQVLALEQAFVTHNDVVATAMREAYADQVRRGRNTTVTNVCEQCDASFQIRGDYSSVRKCAACMFGDDPQMLPATPQSEEADALDLALMALIRRKGSVASKTLAWIERRYGDWYALAQVQKQTILEELEEFPSSQQPAQQGQQTAQDRKEARSATTKTEAALAPVAAPQRGVALAWVAGGTIFVASPYSVSNAETCRSVRYGRWSPQAPNPRGGKPGAWTYPASPETARAIALAWAQRDELAPVPLEWDAEFGRLAAEAYRRQEAAETELVDVI